MNACSLMMMVILVGPGGWVVHTSGRVLSGTMTFLSPSPLVFCKHFVSNVVVSLVVSSSSKI